jgi:hypothetical protein
MLSILDRKRSSYKNSTLRLSVCAALMLAVIVSTNTANAENATGTATAEIRQTVAVAQTAPLNFGTINTTSAETVTIAPDNTVTTLNGASISGSPTAAAFAASGTPNTAVTVSFTDGVVSGAGTPIPVNNFATMQAAHQHLPVTARYHSPSAPTSPSVTAKPLESIRAHTKSL